MEKGFMNLIAVIADVKRKRIVYASLFLMSCFISASAQVKLSFNPASGSKYEYRMEATQSIKQNMMGQEVPMQTEMNVTYLMEVKEKTLQEIRVQFIYQGFAFSITSPMMNMKFDSKKPAENPSEMDNMFGKMYSTLIGKPFTVIFAPDGAVKSVTGMSAIIENMLGAISADGQVAKQLSAQMSQQFSDESMKNMFGQSFNFYPDNAVKVGDSWNKESTMPMNQMKINMKTKNTLKEVSANMATVEVAGTTEMDMGGGMAGKVAGTQTGTMVIDTTNGIPVTSDISQYMKGSIKAEGMEIQMEMVSKTKTTAKKIN